MALGILSLTVAPMRRREAGGGASRTVPRPMSRAFESYRDLLAFILLRRCVRCNLNSWTSYTGQNGRLLPLTRYCRV